MKTTLLMHPYGVFMHDVLSFCETACLTYKIPITLINTLANPFDIIRSNKKSVLASTSDYVADRLERSLLLRDSGFDSEEELFSFNPGGAKIVFIDDIRSVPSIEKLDEWSDRIGATVIARSSEHTTIREEYGYADEEMAILYGAHLEQFRDLRGRKALLYSKLLPLLGIRKEEMSKGVEIGQAKAFWTMSRWRDAGDEKRDMKIAVFHIMLDYIDRCGSSEEEQIAVYEKIKKAVKIGFENLPSGYFDVRSCLSFMEQ